MTLVVTCIVLSGLDWFYFFPQENLLIVLSFTRITLRFPLVEIVELCIEQIMKCMIDWFPLCME